MFPGKYKILLVKSRAIWLLARENRFKGLSARGHGSDELPSSFFEPRRTQSVPAPLFPGKYRILLGKTRDIGLLARENRFKGLSPRVHGSDKLPSSFFGPTPYQSAPEKPSYRAGEFHIFFQHLVKFQASRLL